MFSDVDECKENIDSCNKVLQVCINEIGSYRCETITGVKNETMTTTTPNVDQYTLKYCEPGFSYSYDRKACLGKSFNFTNPLLLLIYMVWLPR